MTKDEERAFVLVCGCVYAAILLPPAFFIMWAFEKLISWMVSMGAWQ